MEQPSYYSILTANVRYDKRLKNHADCKVLYSEITALSNKDGYCHARNKYFADLYDRPVQTISKWINLLKKYGYLKIEMIRDGKQIKERRIYPISTPINADVNTPSRSQEEGINENVNTPINADVKENNTSINTTSKNNTSMNKEQAQPATLAAQRREVIKYLNQKTGKNFKPDADSNKRIINPRLKEGYTVSDMKHIIDDKYAEWHGTTFRNGQPGDNYLNPETLFRPSNIERYNNQRLSRDADTSSGENGSLYDDPWFN